MGATFRCSILEPSTVKLTHRLTGLRPPLKEDSTFLFGLRNDLELQSQLLSLPRPNSPERVQEWVARIAGDEHSVFFIIHECGAIDPVGFIQVREMNFVHGHGVLGICLSPEARGCGHGSAAIHLIQEYCRCIFGLRKLTLQVLGSNEGAVRLYLRLGWRLVGTLEAHFYYNGSHHNVLVMERLLSA